MDYNLWSKDFNFYAPEIKNESNLVDKIFVEADSIFNNKVKDIVGNIIAVSPAIASLAEGLKKTEKLQIVFSPETMKKIHDKTYKMLETVEGKTKAVAVDENGKFRELGEVKTDEVIQGVNATQLLTAIQGAQLQKEMKEITKELQEITHSLDRMESGMHADRIAKYYSAENLYMESRMARDEQRKEALYIQCITKLNDAIAEMGLSLRANIDEANCLFTKNKGKSDNKTKHIISEINELFEVIHKAYVLKTGIYYAQGEIDSMGMSLLQYKTCIENLTSNQDLMDRIYLLDSNAMTLDSGWPAKAKKIPCIIDNALERIGNPEQFLIEIPKEIAV